MLVAAVALAATSPITVRYTPIMEDSQRTEEGIEVPVHATSSPNEEGAQGPGETGTDSVTATEETAVPTATRAYPWKRAIATVFWVGESAAADNGFIHNAASAWDGEWEASFGGYDDPDCRDGFYPCEFVPKENPFYIALPYNDLDDTGAPKANATRIPWYTKSDTSILKNRWIEVQSNGVSCFGQWQDVGPFQEADIEYVFGAREVPLNREGERAGIDLSPAMRDCLKVDGSSRVMWRHVEAGTVPTGPWKEITTR